MRTFGIHFKGNRKINVTSYMNNEATVMFQKERQGSWTIQHSTMPTEELERDWTHIDAGKPEEPLKIFPPSKPSFEIHGSTSGRFYSNDPDLKDVDREWLKAYREEQRALYWDAISTEEIQAQWERNKDYFYSLKDKERGYGREKEREAQQSPAESQEGAN